MKRTTKILWKPQGGNQQLSIYNPQIWSVIVIFTLITLHHYEDQTSFRLFSRPDITLGITRHTIDRILYLLPITLSSFILGPRGGLVSVILAFIAMLPRALFISNQPLEAMWETLVICLIGSLAPLLIDRYRKQTEQLELTKEQLEATQRDLDTTVKLSLEQERQLSVINSLTTMMSKSNELDQIMKTTIGMVMKLIQVEVVLVFSIDEGSKALKLIAYEGINEGSARVLDGIVLGDASHGLTNKIRLREGLRSEHSVPLVAHGEVVGILCVAIKSDRLLETSDIKLLTALGNLIGIAMHNYLLYHARIRAIEKLKLSEKKYRELFENAHDAIWVQDTHGKVITANKAAAGLFGYDLESLVGIDSKNLFLHDDSALSLTQKDELNRAGKQQPYKRTIIRKDGSRAFVMLTANRISIDGHYGAIQFIGRDITKEVRMQEDQSFYLQQITRAHEEERLRISRELHDSTVQSLIGILRLLEKFCEEDRLLPRDRLAVLWGIHKQIKDAVNEVRQLSRDLRPSVIDELGLLPAVEWLINQLKEDHNIDTELTVLGKKRRFTPEIEVTLFRIIQEALRNIIKHACATKAQVVLTFDDKQTIVKIVDNGKGFVLPSSIGELSRHGKLGVDGMQTRTRLVGGTFNVYPNPDRGTTIMVTIPL
ncbi:MAG: PAS domain S-box protein [Actinomycetota bacterium]|nr:PAS domain S-box protein [Actinomycetota bacterium]